jgi:hypothetical protein
MTLRLQPIPSEFPFTGGKFLLLFHQCLLLQNEMLATFEEFDLTFRIINDLFVKKALIGDPSSLGEEDNDHDL